MHHYSNEIRRVGMASAERAAGHPDADRRAEVRVALRSLREDLSPEEFQSAAWMPREQVVELSDPSRASGLSTAGLVAALRVVSAAAGYSCAA